MERKFYGLLIIAAMVLSSCSLLDMNLFEGMDVYEADLGSVSSITEALQNSDPSDWSDAEVQDALNTLSQDLPMVDTDADGQPDAVDTAGMTPEELEAAEEAAILTIAVVMPASGGDEVVDNAVTTMLGTIANGDFDPNVYANDPASAQDLMNGLFGSPQSPADLLDVLIGMNTAQEALTVFNDPSYTDGTNSIDLSDSDMASLMQTAITVTAVSMLYDALDPAGYSADPAFTGATEEEQKAQMLYDLMTQDPGSLLMNDFVSDTTALEAEFTDLSDSISTNGTITGDYSYLSTIIDANGGLTL